MVSTDSFLADLASSFSLFNLNRTHTIDGIGINPSQTAGKDSFELKLTERTFIFSPPSLYARQCLSKARKRIEINST